jgi:hypothetical protein
MCCCLQLHAPICCITTLPNSVSSSIIARVCVFQSDTPLCWQCTYRLPCFFPLFFVCFCSLTSIYCAAGVPHSSAILLWSCVTLSNTDSLTSSNRNIKDATRNTLKYAFGITGTPTVISESSPAQ